MGAVGVSDMPTTTLLVNAAGRHVKRQAYALGAAERGGRLSAAQSGARGVRSQQFIAKLPHGLAGAQSPAARARRLRGAVPRPGRRRARRASCGR